MSLNSKLESALGEYVSGNIWPMVCPLEELPQEWIVYRPDPESPALFADDEDEEWQCIVQVSYYVQGKTNYLAKRKQIKEGLKQAGFTVTLIDDLYVEPKAADGTYGKGYTQIIFRCNILEGEANGQD